jgi:hypothetical protein
MTDDYYNTGNDCDCCVKVPGRPDMAWSSSPDPVQSQCNTKYEYSTVQYSEYTHTSNPSPLINKPPGWLQKEIASTGVVVVTIQARIKCR